MQRRPQVYVLAVMAAVMRAGEADGEPPAQLKFLVPPYDASQIFFPSYAAKRGAKGARRAPCAPRAPDPAGALGRPPRPARPGRTRGGKSSCCCAACRDGARARHERRGHACAQPRRVA